MRSWLSKRISRVVFGVLAVTSSGWSTWERDLQKGQVSDVGRAAQNTAAYGLFNGATPYLFVRASIDRPADARNICGDTWVSSALRQKDVAVALAAELGEAVKIPLLSQGYDGDKRNCLKDFNSAFVVPRVMADQEFLSVPINMGWTQGSKSKVSGYLDQGLKLVGALGGTTAPVVSTISTVVASELAKEVEAEVNKNMTFSDQTRFSAIELEMKQARKDMVNKDYAFQVCGVETTNFQPKAGGQRVHLATLTLRLRWVRSAVGEDTGQGVVFSDDPPANTRVRVFTGNPNETSKTLSQLMADRSVDTAVPYMSAETDWNSARTGCNAFRKAFPEFNQLDQTAMLWIAYRQSNKAMQSAKNNFASDPCFSKKQVDALSSMGLPPVTSPVAMAPFN